MKKRALALCLFVGLGIGEGLALSPKPKDDPAQNATPDSSLPASQEATEQSVLPGEPALIDPPTDTVIDPGNLQVQPLPEPEVPAAGSTQDELRKRAEGFRAAKTAAEEQPELTGLKNDAGAARTEREKRALLRKYYASVANWVTHHYPAFKDDAEAWSYAKQMRLGQTRTDPRYVAPVPPAALVAAAASASPSPTPKKKRAGGLSFPGI